MRSDKFEIVKAAYGGYGLAFADGMAVFIPYAFPGDWVRAAITVRKKNHAFAEIVDLIEPSPMRVAPECPNFGRCGGCDYLGIRYEHELEIKRTILLESIARIGGIRCDAMDNVMTIDGPRFGYRSHATVKYELGNTGLFAGGTSSLVPFPSSGCLLATEGINEGLRAIPPPGKGEFRIAEDAAGRVFRSYEADTALEEKEAGIVYRRHISCFFQANRFLRGKMLVAVGEFAGLEPGMGFLDLGCGSGFFTLYLGKNGNRGAGIDRDERSIYWARENARLNAIESVEFHVGDAGSFDARGHVGDTVVVDPPRAGLSPRTRSLIVGLLPRRIVYVSCNPATFARDLRDFESSGYRLVGLKCIDMFPGTMHIEVVGMMER